MAGLSILPIWNLDGGSTDAGGLLEVLVTSYNGIFISLACPSFWLRTLLLVHLRSVYTRGH
jgi:hypothetical protein